MKDMDESFVQPNYYTKNVKLINIGYNQSKNKTRRHYNTKFRLNKLK